jgi:hypothetical protein
MSSSIWTHCAGARRLRPLEGVPWRVVEAQHLVSTRKLVDTLEEQALLEDLLEASKPPVRAAAPLHVLLTTPFRYPPLKHGSRFGRRHEPSLWYGSESQRTLFAELAYYRLVFQAGTSVELGTLRTWHTAFSVRYKTQRGIDLGREPFEARRAEIASPSDYGATQALGSEMRKAGVEAFRFPSARDARGGSNVGIFTPAVFGVARPRALETWHCTAERQRVEVVRRDFFDERSFTFLREEFLVGGRLPVPAV